MTEQLTHVPIRQIKAAACQPRKEFHEDEIRELKNSIAEIGLIHPPVVRKNGDAYELISGERRLRAYELLGKELIPVIVRVYDDKTAAIGALVENIQRVDLNPMEVALGIKNLMEEFHLTQHEVSLKVGKERSTISNYLRILQLPISIQKSLRENGVSMGHAKALLAIDCPLGQELLHEAIIREGLSVRETEDKARKAPKKVQRDFYLEEIERKIRDKLGVRVTIEGNGKKGKVTLSYANLDDIDRILSALGIEMGL